MKYFRVMRMKWIEHWFKTKGVPRVQRHQMDERNEIIQEIKVVKRHSLHDLADAVLKLQAISDRLEESIEEMQGQADDGYLGRA